MPFRKKTLRDVDLKGKRVLVRVDFNVPMDELGNIEDDTRIRASLPTIEYLLDAKAKIILMSHLGRPKGRDERFSLMPVAKRLSRYINREVKMLSDCVGEEVEREVYNMKEGEVILLENLRFHEGESKGNEDFARALARLGEVYVSDAFGTCHRKHASVYLVPQILKPAVMGFLLEREISYFERAMVNPQRPVVAIIGGAKVSSKLGIIKNLLKRVDKLFIGGAMAFTFIKALGYKVGSSLVEEDQWLKGHIKNYFESFSPLEIAKALKGARLFIGNDSGISHLASYCGLPTFLFYGPTDPVVWKPIGEKVFQISLSLECSPCFPQVCQERRCLDVKALFTSFKKAWLSSWK